jgi:subfamily B ATP-binding cassette protein MsbA
MVLMAVIGGVASYVDNYYTESVGQWVANDLRLRIYEHLEHLSFRYYDSHQTGALLSTMTDDVARVQDFVSSDALGILVDVTTVIGMLVVMFWLDWNFTLIVVAITPLLLLAIARFRRSVKTATGEVRRRQSDVVAVVESGLQSVRTVQALGAQEVEQARLAGASRAAVASALHARRIKSVLSPFVNVIVALCTAIVLWRGTDLVLARAMTIGSLTVFLAYLARFFKPVQDLAKMTNALAQTHVAPRAYRRISTSTWSCRTRLTRRVRRRSPERSSSIASPRLHRRAGLDGRRRRLRCVQHRWTDRSGVDGREPHSSLGDPSAPNSITRRANTPEPAGQIAFCAGDCARRTTVITLRRAARRDRRSRSSGAKSMPTNLPRLPGSTTRRSANEATLSGGQRQRIGVARAFIRDAPILILDEPTASLDPESEQLVLEGLRRLMKGRTVIMITHRLHTLHDADQIVVVSGGVIAERGSHDDLLRRDGVYASLYRATPDLAGLAGVAS